MLKLFHHLLDAGDGDVDARHCRAHATIAFVLDQAERAGFSHRKVDARQADPGLGKLASQHPAADADQAIDIVGIGHAGNFPGEQLGDLLPGLVDRRHDDVRGRFAGQLDNVFTHVGLECLDAGFGHRMVEADLLTDHRLAFDDAFRPGKARDRQRYVVGFSRRLRPVHLHALSGQIRLELLQQPGQMGQAVAADRCAEFAQ